MNDSQKIRQVRRTLKIFSISLILFALSPSNAVANGSHGYNYGYGHDYGHHGYRYYGRHGYGVHYSHHGNIGTAGYVFLGILGVAVLSQILDNGNDRDRRYRQTPTYYQPAYNQAPDSTTTGFN